MFIKNFSQFWRAEEVDWFPGQGNRNSFRLLERQGINLPGVRLADFRHMQGIYILYANHGPYYQVFDHEVNYYIDKLQRK